LQVVPDPDWLVDSEAHRAETRPSARPPTALLAPGIARRVLLNWPSAGVAPDHRWHRRDHVRWFPSPLRGTGNCQLRESAHYCIAGVFRDRWARGGLAVDWSSPLAIRRCSQYGWCRMWKATREDGEPSRRGAPGGRTRSPSPHPARDQLNGLWAQLLGKPADRELDIALQPCARLSTTSPGISDKVAARSRVGCDDINLGQRQHW
jgi:hypothetical protein